MGEKTLSGPIGEARCVLEGRPQGGRGGLRPRRSRRGLPVAADTPLSSLDGRAPVSPDPRTAPPSPRGSLGDRLTMQFLPEEVKPLGFRAHS